MAKRKAPEGSTIGESPTRRATRSSSALSIVQPSVNVSSPALKKRRGPSGVSTSHFPPPKRVCGRQAAKFTDSSSQKENIVSDNEGDKGSESDELNIAPENKLVVGDGAPNKRSARRVVFDAIEIVTPKKLPESNVLGRRRQASPTPGASTNTATLKNKSTSKPTPNQTLAFDHFDPGLVEDKSPVRLPTTLPTHLVPYLSAQKRAILEAFQYLPLSTSPQVDESEEATTNDVSLQQLTDLMSGTVERGEGNSCLVIGPPGSGKTKLFEQALGRFADEKKIVIRLSGHVQRTDKLAMREIARQVVEQTGNQRFSTLTVPDDDDNPFADSGDIVDNEQPVGSGALPPPSHLPSLISALPNLSRPVLVLLDGFDLFTHHPRQGLLYCLLDTVQSCRAGSSNQNGLAVIGLTSRVDVVNLLEKRVKSRFSHRTLRTAGMRKVDDWLAVLKGYLFVKPDSSQTDFPDSIRREWQRIWQHSVNMFMEDRSVRSNLNEVFGITRDIRVLLRAVTNAITRLDQTRPFLAADALRSHIDSQRNSPSSTFLSKLSYPSLSLLIAAQHARTAGHDTFTFEMLRELFQNQVRTSSAAPVLLSGGGIGMVNVSKGVLMGAFEQLVAMRIFLPAMSSSAGLAKDFVKHRCVVERGDVKTAIERVGQTNLKKWFSKAH